MIVRLLVLLSVLLLGGCISVGFEATEVAPGSAWQTSGTVSASSVRRDHVGSYRERMARLKESQARQALPHLLDGTNAKKVFSVRISGCFSGSKGYICLNNGSQNLRGGSSDQRGQSAGLRNTPYCHSSGKQDPRCYGYFAPRKMPRKKPGKHNHRQ